MDGLFQSDARSNKVFEAKIARNSASSTGYGKSLLKEDTRLVEMDVTLPKNRTIVGWT